MCVCKQKTFFGQGKLSCLQHLTSAVDLTGGRLLPLGICGSDNSTGRMQASTVKLGFSPVGTNLPQYLTLMSD